MLNNFIVEGVVDFRLLPRPDTHTYHVLERHLKVRAEFVNVCFMFLHVFRVNS